MTHNFYQKTEREQSSILWKTIGALIITCGIILLISVVTGFYLLLILLPVIILIAAPFIDLPMGKKAGKFIYYSPLFIAEKERDNKIVVHGGTLFDYFHTIHPGMNAGERRSYVLYGYLLGLSRLISEHENQDKDNLRVRGTSYIINSKTARRFGFKPVKTDVLQFFILLFNYIPITLSSSFIRRKLHFPNFSQIQTFEGELNDLILHKNKLHQLKNRLEKN